VSKVKMQTVESREVLMLGCLIRASRRSRLYNRLRKLEFGKSFWECLRETEARGITHGIIGNVLKPSINAKAGDVRRRQQT